MLSSIALPSHARLRDTSRSVWPPRPSKRRRLLMRMKRRGHKPLSQLLSEFGRHGTARFC